MNQAAAPSPNISDKRREFLDAALSEHLSAEQRGDLDDIVATYSPRGGHLRFNGTVYDTPEQLFHFHRALGFDNTGALADINGTVERTTYTHDSVILEVALSARVTSTLAGHDGNGRSVTAFTCAIYQFDHDGKLASERVYFDTGALLPEPVLDL